VDKAAKKLEEEIGPLAEAASKCVRGIVSRLSYGLDVQQLAREALEAADLLQDPSENSDGISQDTQMDSMVSDGVHFKDLSPTSVVLCWRGPDVQLAPDIQGYQIWHHKISDLGFIERPTCTLPKTERRALISNLEPSTEYMFKVSFTWHHDQYYQIFGIIFVCCYDKEWMEIALKEEGNNSNG
jgi:hypothetical protein